MATWGLLRTGVESKWDEIDAVAEQIWDREYRTESEIAPVLRHMIEERDLWAGVVNAETREEARLLMRRVVRREVGSGVYAYRETLPPTNTIGLYFGAVLDPNRRTIGFKLGQGRIRERMLSHLRRWPYMNPMWMAELGDKGNAEVEEHRLRGVVAEYLDSGKLDQGTIPFSWDSSHIVDSVDDFFETLPTVAKWNNRLPGAHLLYSVLMAGDSGMAFQMGLL